MRQPEISAECSQQFDAPFPQGSLPTEVPQRLFASPQDCLMSKRGPTSHILTSAADIYFRFCHNQPYSFFHEATLRCRISSDQLPACLGWALVAVARRYATISDFTLETQDDALRCAEYAWSCLDLSWGGTASDGDAVTMVQAILLIVNIENPGRCYPRSLCYYKNYEKVNTAVNLAGRCSSAYLKLGFALRLAALHGLQKEPDANMPHPLREERRRTFWSLYLQDRLISLSKDRYSTIRDESITVRLPCSEQAFCNGDDEEDDVPRLNCFSGDNIDMTTAAKCCPLALIPVMASMLDRVSRFALQKTDIQNAAPPWSPASPLTAISSTLLELEHLLGMNEPTNVGLQKKCSVNGVLDHHLAGSFIYAKALFHLSQCLLYHPFLLDQKLRKLEQNVPPSFMKMAWESCRSHAIKLTDLEAVREHNLSALTSLYGYCAMVAGTIHVFSMTSENEVIKKEGEKYYLGAHAFLEELAVYWKHASLMVRRNAQ